MPKRLVNSAPFFKTVRQLWLPFSGAVEPFCPALRKISPALAIVSSIIPLRFILASGCTDREEKISSFLKIHNRHPVGTDWISPGFILGTTDVESVFFSSLAPKTEGVMANIKNKYNFTFRCFFIVKPLPISNLTTKINQPFKSKNQTISHLKPIKEVHTNDQTH